MFASKAPVGESFLYAKVSGTAGRAGVPPLESVERIWFLNVTGNLLAEPKVRRVTGK